jgi:hypothetical protein
MERAIKLILLGLSAILAAGGVGGWASGSVARDAYESRVTKLETEQTGTEKRLDRIEGKLDTVLDRLQRPGWRDSRGGR